MANIPGKPIGYFDKVLALDCETTGLKFHGDDPSVGHQAVSWGFIVADANTFETVEELYVEIKWNDDSKLARKKDPQFGKKAESIHGLTFDHLEKNGVTEQKAVEQIATLILKHWGPDSCIRLLGHNVVSFDMWFLKRLMRQFDIELKFGSRHLDSSSLAFGTIGAFNSDDLFETMGLDSRDEHNALEDARCSLESFRRIKLLWNKKVGITCDR